MFTHLKKPIKMPSIPTVEAVFDYKHKCTSVTPRCAVMIRVIHQRKVKYYNPGVRIMAHEWDKTTRTVVNRMDAAELNERIAYFTGRIQGYITKLIKSGREFSIDALTRYLDCIGNGADFIEFMRNQIETRKDLRPNTIKGHRTSLHKLEEYGGIKHFRDLDHDNIRQFDAWLHDKHPGNQMYIHSLHKGVRAYCTMAYQLGLLDENPYKRIRISRGSCGMRKYVPFDDLRKIATAKMPTASMQAVRDLFMLQTYTGLAYADLFAIDFKKTDRRDRRSVVAGQRTKTGENYYISLIAPAIEILERYGYELPRLTNQQYNMRLKALADYAGVDIKLTSHMARHTFAVMAINGGIKIEVLAKMMGHNDIKTTQHYGKIIDRTAEDAFERLAEFMESKGIVL